LLQPIPPDHAVLVAGIQALQTIKSHDDALGK
jgi:hypothetical protein